MNKKSELKSILLMALDSPTGLRAVITTGDANRCQLALAALKAAKRELVEEEPEALDLIIKQIRKDEIAIYNPARENLGEG